MLTLNSCLALPLSRDDRKARAAAKGCSLGKVRNAASARLKGNPQGWGVAGALPCWPPFAGERPSRRASALHRIPRHPSAGHEFSVNTP